MDVKVFALHIGEYILDIVSLVFIFQINTENHF